MRHASFTFPWSVPNSGISNRPLRACFHHDHHVHQRKTMGKPQKLFVNHSQTIHITKCIVHGPKFRFLCHLSSTFMEARKRPGETQWRGKFAACDEGFPPAPILHDEDDDDDNHELDVKMIYSLNIPTVDIVLIHWFSRIASLSQMDLPAPRILSLVYAIVERAPRDGDMSWTNNLNCVQWIREWMCLIIRSKDDQIIGYHLRIYQCHFNHCIYWRDRRKETQNGPYRLVFKHHDHLE